MGCLRINQLQLKQKYTWDLCKIKLSILDTSAWDQCSICSTLVLILRCRTAVLFYFRESSLWLNGEARSTLTSHDVSGRQSSACVEKTARGRGSCLSAGGCASWYWLQYCEDCSLRAGVLPSEFVICLYKFNINNSCCRLFASFWASLCF